MTQIFLKSVIGLVGLGLLIVGIDPPGARYVSTVEYKVPMDLVGLEPMLIRFKICSQSELATCETKSKFMALELKELQPYITDVRYECELKEWYQRLGDCQQR